MSWRNVLTTSFVREAGLNQSNTKLKKSNFMNKTIACAFITLSLAACMQQQNADEMSPDIRHAIDFLKNEPFVTSNDAMTYSMAGLWSAECKRNSKMWQAGVQACAEPGRHPPVCQLISTGTARCP